MSVKKSNNDVFMSLHGYVPERISCKLPGTLPGTLSGDILQGNSSDTVPIAERVSRINVLESEAQSIAQETQTLINLYAKQLQALLHLLPEFPHTKVPDEVLDYYLQSTGDLIKVLHHLGNAAGNIAGNIAGDIAADSLKINSLEADDLEANSMETNSMETNSSEVENGEKK